MGDRWIDLTFIFFALLRDGFGASERRLTIDQTLHQSFLTETSFALVLFGRLAVLIDASVRDGFAFFDFYGVRVVIALRDWDGGEAQLVVHFDHFRLVVWLFRGFVIVVVVLIAAAGTAAAAALVLVAVFLFAHFGQLGSLAASVFDQVIHVILTQVLFFGEVRVAEFVNGFLIEMTAQTALLTLIILSQFDVDSVSVEFDLDASLGQLDIDRGTFLIDLGDQVTVFDHILIDFRIVRFAVDLDLDRFVFVALGHQFDTVRTSDDLDIFQILTTGALFGFASHDHEFGFGRTAILGQDDPTVGERGAEFGAVERFDLRATLPTRFAGDRALSLVVGRVFVVQVVAELFPQRLFLVEDHQRFG